MDDVHIITNDDGLRRLVVYRNGDGTFGFREEKWYADEFVAGCWIPCREPDSHCDTLEKAISEARSRMWREDS